MNQKPKYLIAEFGKIVKPHQTAFGSGCYPPARGFHPEKVAKPGDFLLLYCAGTYPDETVRTTAPAIGVVYSATPGDGLRYRCFLLTSPVPKSKILACVPNQVKERFKRLHWSTNFLFEISEKAFRDILGDNVISLPQQEIS